MTAVVEQTTTRWPVRQGRFTALVAVRHPAARETAVRILRALGASDVLAATTVEEARRVSTGRPGELCVVEAGLSDGSGVELARDLRLAGWQRTIVVSTTDDPYTVRAALTAGVRCYLGTGHPTSPAASVPASVHGLSQREVEVLQLVADGCSNRDVGDALGLSALTVKSHLARIARKVGTGDRAEMVMIALRAGVIS
ncbi:MAG TPA: response regulator transcription factor [Actinomycetales bacterium]|nr:response regulator transcription factor [Actinomycetales bacterium]